MNRIRYKGKMSDLIPAWAFIVTLDYATDVTQYRKVSDYLKKAHPNKKRVKIDLVEIVEITQYDIMHTMGITSTWFTVDKTQYRIIQAITMYISDFVSSVRGHAIVLGDCEGNILVEVN